MKAPLLLDEAARLQGVQRYAKCQHQFESL
jgi:hypothetical protein